MLFVVLGIAMLLFSGVSTFIVGWIAVIWIGDLVGKWTHLAPIRILVQLIVIALGILGMAIDLAAFLR